MFHDLHLDPEADEVAAEFVAWASRYGECPGEYLRQLGWTGQEWGWEAVKIAVVRQWRRDLEILSTRSSAKKKRLKKAGDEMVCRVSFQAIDVRE